MNKNNVSENSSTGLSVGDFWLLDMESRDLVFPGTDHKIRTVDWVLQNCGLQCQGAIATSSIGRLLVFAASWTGKVDLF
jgi:hypothetical protein